MDHNDAKDEKINFLIEENRKLSQNNKINQNVLDKMHSLQLENIELKKKISNSEEDLKQLDILRSEVIQLRIQITNMKPGGKADPLTASRQTVISQQNKKNEEGKYKKRAEQMKFFLKKKNIYGEYSIWKKRI